MSLNKEQKSIVELPIDRTVKILAGAGTGKTRVLVSRYLKFIFDDKVPPERVLALTFTKKAAAEMQERVFKSVVERGDRDVLRALYGAWIINFHQFAFRVIKENTAAFAIDPEVAVASEVDLARVRQEVWRRFEAGSLDGMPEFEDDMPTPNDLEERFDKAMRIIDHARGRMWTRESFLATVKSDDVPSFRRYMETVAALWMGYEQGLRQRRLLDFPDLIHTVVDRFRADDSLRREYAGRFDHILVDEFQDTSAAQNEMLRQLSDDQFTRVTVVGDEKQSIYRWRDAQVENIRSFPGSEHYLHTNYRSLQSVLDLAHGMIVEDAYFASQGDDLKLAAERGGVGASVTVFHPPDGQRRGATEDEARALGDWILTMTQAVDGPGLPYESIAILMRSLKPASGLPQYERELKRLGIPYAILGGISALEERVLETFKNMLRLLMYPEDVRAFIGTIEAKPFEVPDKDIRDIFAAAGKPHHVSKLLSERVLSEVSSSARTRLELLRDTLDALDERRGRLDFAAFITEAMVVSPFFLQLFDGGADLRIIDSIQKRIFELVEQLTHKNEANLAAFVEAVQTLLNKKQFGEEDAPYLPPGRVVIMTQHQAKGLEFPAVAIPGIKSMPPRSDGFFLIPGEGLFLSDSSNGKEWHRRSHDCSEYEQGKVEHTQEERCLLYVAITRAEDHLFISSPYANGLEYQTHRKHPVENSFAAVLRSLDANAIRYESVRDVTEHEPGSARAQEHTQTTTGDSLHRLVTRWEADRDRLAEARLLTKPSPQGLSFVTWRGIHSFSKCPLQYYYRNVAAIQDDLWVRDDADPNQEERSQENIKAGVRLPANMTAAEFGSAVHEIMVELVDGAHADRRAAIAHVLTRHGRSDQIAAFDDAMTNADFATEGSAFQLEWPVRRRTGNTVLHGIIDRVDRDGGGYHVMDYKVGAELTEYAFQVQFYAWLLQPVLDGEVRGSVAYLRGGGGFRDVDVSAAVMERMGSTAAGLDSAIRHAEYPAHPGIACETCDYRTICPHALC